MGWVATTLHHAPELAMFLAVAVGYWPGNIKLGKFSLGTVTAALFAGLVIGQVGASFFATHREKFATPRPPINGTNHLALAGPLLSND